MMDLLSKNPHQMINSKENENLDLSAINRFDELEYRNKNLI